MIIVIEYICTIMLTLFQAATSIAEEMVNSYGMSEKVGFSFRRGNGGDGYQPGPSTSDLVDNEVKRLLQVNFVVTQCQLCILFLNDSYQHLYIFCFPRSHMIVQD